MIGVVLAGGASTRFGGRAKGLVQLGGRAMALRVADMLRGFCVSVVVEATPGAGYEVLGLPLVHATSAHAGKGPLAGFAAGLSLAADGERLAFAPCDMPLLQDSIYVALTKGAVGASGAYAVTRHGAEALVAVLDARVRAVVLEALAGDPPRTHAVLDKAGARAVHFDDLAPFTNVNTPDDLASLVRGSD